jgi:hypothetical protein
MHAQVLRQLGIAAALRQNRRVQSQQVNPSANLQVASGFLLLSRLDEQSKDRQLAGAGRVLFAVLFLVLVGPVAPGAPLAPQWVNLCRPDNESWSVRIGIPSQSGGQSLASWRPHRCWLG